MSIHLSAALVAALVATAPTVVTAQTAGGAATATQPGPGWSVLRTYSGTIVRVDASTRIVTSRDAAGNTWIFEAPPALPSAELAGFAPGQPVTVTFYDGLDAKLRTAAGSSVASSIDPATGLRSATVTVTSVNPATRTLTFVGPRGQYTRRIAEGGDTSVLKTLTAGQRIDLSYFEYVVSMTRGASGAAASTAPPAPPPAPSDSLRDRMTVNFLYGVDNSFTGKMIEAATGRTTTGVPINLEETTYDEVYGRLGLIKVGVGYLMTPRIEAVVNFVYSNSSANFEATQIGTAGTNPQIPLKVNFTNYRYVGVEGGQRFSFPLGSGRVAPFVGWIAGINRNQDIRGTFVGVPVNVTPGLAAQDGKFFERSWAFSVGPTGGVIIGAGPIDIVAESGLRFLGGLSDVDWLVEEGLRDINGQSERWSVPFLAGVRFKF